MELLARPPGGGSGHGDADGGGTRGGDTRGRGGAWAAERAVAAVLAATGSGGWGRRPAATLLAAACGGGAAVAARRRRCSALPQQARPDSTGSLPARPAHSNAPAAPADCWMATVAKVGEVRAAPWQRWPGGPSRCATATALRSRASPCCRLDEGHLSRLSIGKTLPLLNIPAGHLQRGDPSGKRMLFAAHARALGEGLCCE